MERETLDLTMEQRRELSDRVESSTLISSEEKETVVKLLGGADHYTVMSYRASVVRKLLEHELGDVMFVTTEDDGFRHHEDNVPDDGTPVVGVQVRLPVGTLSIRGTARSNDYHSLIVSTPEQVEEVREAFADD